MTRTIAKSLEPYAIPMMGSSEDYDEILAMADSARFVLIGEASHGTHEFYQVRAEITQRLIAEKDFMAVAVEADWPDAYRINRYVRGDETIDNAEDALDDFKRFPQWMWRNTEVRNFVDWLYNFNHSTKGKSVGFYGLDLYSLHRSMESVVEYLDQVDPDAAHRARRRYSCFDAYPDPQSYGYATGQGMDAGCHRQILMQLLELRQQTFLYMRQGGLHAREEFFSAEQNARLVTDAERYYRALFRGRPSSWNIRDTHMADTIDQLSAHLTRKNGRPAKIVVWAHNSHVGDASATSAKERGEVSIGELMRKRHRGKTLLVGFSTYKGTVTASSDWDKPEEHKVLKNALPSSVETIFHKVGVKNFILNIRDNEEVKKILEEPRLERFIGVIYRPKIERHSHYFQAAVGKEFDAMIHLDETRALTPLIPGHLWKPEAEDLAETYPSGM